MSRPALESPDKSCRVMLKMAVKPLVVFAVVFCSLSTEACTAATSGSRPQNDPFCQPLVPFCPNGRASIPKLNASDTLYVYSMKAPLFEDTLGDFFGKYHLMHDAIGFHHAQSGLNFTVERAAMGDVLNATFPHELSNGSMVWCNQGASCFSLGIDVRHWKENGTLVKVAEINGTVFNNFTTWVESDNSTNFFYESFTIWQKQGIGRHDATIEFESCDSAQWVQKAFKVMADSGAAFDKSIHLQYTRINLYSDRAAEQLGPPDQIDKKDWKDILEFYKDFQYKKSMIEMMAAVYRALFRMYVERKFYLYHDEKYYRLHLTEPIFNVTYDEVSLW